MADGFKEVDRFWPDPAMVALRKEWETYHRAVERGGMVVIERVYPPVGDTTKETVFDAALLTYAEADALIPQMMAAMEEVKKKEEANATKNTD